MLELDEATRRALSQRYGPTPESQARVLAELRSTLGGPVGPDGGGGEGGPPTGAPPAGSGQVVWIAKICAATVGLTGAGLLVLKLGASVVGSDVRAPERAPAEVSAPARVAPSSPEAPKEVQADVDAELPAEPPVAAPTRAPSKRSAEASTLAAELALLDAAKRILDSDPAAALVHLERHQKEFPAGTLAPEREKLRTEVSRVLGTGSDKRGD
jgi:hypothetical protein